LIEMGVDDLHIYRVEEQSLGYTLKSKGFGTGLMPCVRLLWYVVCMHIDVDIRIYETMWT